MAAITTTEVASFLNSFLSTTAYTKPVSPFALALVISSALPTDTAAGTEVTGGSYARQAITFSGALSGVRASASTNGQTFTLMPAATTGAVNIYDSTGSPRRLAYGNLAANKTTDAGDTLSFAVGAITLTIG